MIREGNSASEAIGVKQAENNTQRSTSSPNERGRGSIRIGLALFVVLGVVVLVFAVDVSRYYWWFHRAHGLAERGALRAARTVETPRDRAVVRDHVRDVVRRQVSSVSAGFETEVKLRRRVLRPAASGPSSKADTVYRIALTVSRGFNPYFLPRTVFGDRRPLVRVRAVAERATSSSDAVARVAF